VYTVARATWCTRQHLLFTEAWNLPRILLLRTFQNKGGSVVKKGEEQVSKADSPRQGEPRDPDEPKIKHKGGSKNQTNARGQGQGSSSKG
jgi:hypothetical protein